MLSFITTVLFFVALFCLGMAIYKAVTQVADHVRRNPEAGKALFDHLFMPLFGDKKESKATEPKANPD